MTVMGLFLAGKFDGRGRAIFDGVLDQVGKGAFQCERPAAIDRVRGSCIADLDVLIGIVVVRWSAGRPADRNSSLPPRRRRRGRRRARHRPSPATRRHRGTAVPAAPRPRSVRRAADPGQGGAQVMRDRRQHRGTVGHELLDLGLHLVERGGCTLASSARPVSSDRRSLRIWRRRTGVSLSANFLIGRTSWTGAIVDTMAVDSARKASQIAHRSRQGRPQSLSGRVEDQPARVGKLHRQHVGMRYFVRSSWKLRRSTSGIAGAIRFQASTTRWRPPSSFLIAAGYARRNRRLPAQAQSKTGGRCIVPADSNRVGGRGTCELLADRRRCSLDDPRHIGSLFQQARVLERGLGPYAAEEVEQPMSDQVTTTTSEARSARNAVR